MKVELTIFGLFLTFLLYGQAQNDTVKVIARLITPEEGSKVYTAEYEVIKVLQGTITNARIKVGYYFYKRHSNPTDTVLLNLIAYAGDTKIKDYYIFPDYDARKGIEKVRLEFVSFEYWENCEKGEDCKPLTFTRNSSTENFFLILPCGGTATGVTLSKKPGGMLKEGEIIQHSEIFASECPPIFDLTDLPDGKYYAYMIACGLGGQIEINITTE